MGFFKDKTVVMSGGSRGIGLEIAKTLGKDGANVAILAKTTEPHPKLPGTLYTAAEDIENAGGNALPLVCDIRFEEQVQDSINQVVEKFSDSEVSGFQDELSQYGYKLQFVSLAGFHSMASAMYELATQYKGGNMKAFVDLQKKEMELEKKGYTATKHQQEVDFLILDNVNALIFNHLVILLRGCKDLYKLLKSLYYL